MNKVVLTLALAGSLGLSACVVEPYHAHPHGGPVVWAPVAPPPMRIETRPPPPQRGYLWVPGYWGWEANQHRWHEGRWEAPRERQQWVPHRWEQDGGGRWRLNEGYWRRD